MENILDGSTSCHKYHGLRQVLIAPIHNLKVLGLAFQYGSVINRVVKFSAVLECNHILFFIPAYYRVSERSRLGDLVKEVLKRIEGDLNEDEISVYKTTQLKDFDVLLKCEFMQTYSKENLR